MLNNPKHINAVLAESPTMTEQGNKVPINALPVSRLFETWVGRLFLMLTVSILSTSVQAQPILDRMEFVGQWGLGSYNSVASRGDVTIYGCGASLRIFDTTNPREMYEISRIQIMSRPTDLIIRGDIVFVTTEPELVIFDISEPGSPRVISRNRWTGRGGPIALDETYLFVSSRDSVLRVFDISNLEQVALLDSTRLDGFYSRDIGFSHGLIFIASHNNQPSIITYSWNREQSFIEKAEYRSNEMLWIGDEFELGNGIGVTNDGSIFIYSEDTLYATVNISNEYRLRQNDLPTIHDSLLFAIGWEDGISHFYVINISDPYHPRQLGHFESEYDFAIGAYASGYCFARKAEKRVLVSVENLRRPTIVSIVEDADRILCMDIYQGGLYFKAGKTIWSLNIDDNRTPYVLDSIFLESDALSSYDEIMTADNGTLFVKSDNLIVSINIEDPTNICAIDSLHGDFQIGRAHIEVNAELGLLTDYDCLYSIDLSNPGHFVPLDTLVMRAPLAIGKVNEDVAYISDDYSGYFYIVDIGDPSDLSVVSRFRLGSDVFDFYIDGDLAYVAAYGGLAILDINNPVSPQIISTYIPQVTPRAINSIEKSGSLLYAEGSRGQIFVFSLEDPRNFELIGMVVAGGSSSGIAVYNECVYRSDSFDGLKFFRHEMYNRVEYADDPEEFGQYRISCFPNPLNGVGTVRLSVPWAKRGTIELYSLNGREIATFTTSPLTASTQNMAVDFSRFASGSYFIKYQSDDFAIQSKIVIIR